MNNNSRLLRIGGRDRVIVLSVWKGSVVRKRGMD